jgi:RecB family exonuclease
MTRKLILAPFGAHDAAERLLREALKLAAEPRDILYLCPSPRRLRLAEAELLSRLEKDAVVPPRFASLTQLARDIHDRHGSARRLLPELKPLLVQQLLSAEAASPKPQAPSRSHAGSRSASDYSTFDIRHSTFPSIGYSRAVAGFITEIRRYVPAVDQANLRQRIQGLLEGFPQPLARLLECLDCLDRYEAALARLDWTDDEGIMAEAARLVGETVLPGVLVLDSFVAPNRLESDLLRALIEKSKSCLVLGYAGDPRDADYALPGKFAEFVASCGRFETERLPEPAPVLPSFYEYPDIEEEVKAVCRAIITQNAAASETFVAVPKLAEFAPLIKRVFEAYGVDVTVYPETSLATSPPVVAVLELLRANDTGYERIATTAAFGSPYLPGLLALDTDEDSAARDRAAAALNHYSRKGRIIKGRRDWARIADSVQATEDYELQADEQKFLRDIQSRVRHALDLLDETMKEKATPGAFARGLKQLLGRAGFVGNIDPVDDTEAELLVNRKSLYDILDTLADFETEFGGQEESRGRFIKTLTYLVENSKRTADHDPAGVTVVDMTETLGIHPPRLFFCGLTEKSLPSPYSPDPILPDRVRKALGMPDVDWHRDHERFHFRRTLESSPNPPVLSLHSSQDGQPVLPSPFLALKPEKVKRSDAIYSDAEEQAAQGRAVGKAFAETTIDVDFSGDKEVLAELAADFGPSRPVSVTRLENYQRCPYEFYIDHVLGIETPEEPRYDVDARQWGLVIHLVMEKLYADGPVAIDKLEAAARKALDATLKEVDLPPFWTEVTRRVFTGLLPEVISTETELREGGFVPGRAELRLRGSLDKNINLKGRADRVDTAGKRFRIIDYKTGAPRNYGGKAVLEGTHLQLPLYAWMYEHGDKGMQADNFGIYGLREPGVYWFAGRKYDVKQLIEAAVANAVDVVGKIRSGRFPALPGDDNACEYCGLGHTCGYREAPRES